MSAIPFVLATHVDVQHYRSLLGVVPVPPPTPTPGYAVGLIATFIALVLMETGQPALLYLVPCTLLPTLISALVHREFKQLLLGPRKEEAQVSTLFLVQESQVKSKHGLWIHEQIELIMYIHVYVHTYINTYIHMYVFTYYI